MYKLGLACLIASSSAACVDEESGDAAPAPSIGGLVQSQASFTMSPDRCAISMLFDDFQFTLPAAPGRDSAERTFTVSGGAGRSFQAYVRGAYVAPEALTASIALDVAGKRHGQQLARKPDEQFLVHFTGRLPATGQTRVRLLASLKGEPMAGETVLLDIDSIDVTFESKPCI